MHIRSVSLAALAMALVSVNCVKSDLQDPVGQIRRLVNRYNPSIFPNRVAMPAPRTVQNYTDAGDEAADGIANAMRIGTVSANNTTSVAQALLKVALDQVTERNQQLSLETMMLDKAWPGIVFYCRYFNNGNDASGGTASQSTANTTRTNNWVSCTVPQDAISAEVDQDLIAAVIDSMGGDDISEADKKELQALDGKAVNLQEMKITRNGGGTPTDSAANGEEFGYAYKVEYNHSETANRRLIRFNAARTKISIADYETHTNSDGSKFESRSHFNTVNESSLSGKQISQLQLSIKEGKENYTFNVTMQQWDSKVSTNGLYVTTTFEENGVGNNFIMFAQGAMDDAGGFAKATYNQINSSTGFTPGSDGNFLVVTNRATCTGIDWDDAIGLVTRESGSVTFDEYWGSNVTNAARDICKVSLDEDGNITSIEQTLLDQTIDPVVNAPTTTVYHELFDSSGALISSTSDGNVNSTMTSSEYYQAYAASLSGGKMVFSDDIDFSLGGTFTDTNFGDFIIIPFGKTCSTTDYHDYLLGYGKYLGGTTSSSLNGDFSVIFWGDSSQKGNGANGNKFCNLDFSANGTPQASANAGYAN